MQHIADSVTFNPIAGAATLIVVANFKCLSVDSSHETKKKFSAGEVNTEDYNTALINSQCSNAWSASAGGAVELSGIISQKSSKMNKSKS